MSWFEKEFGFKESALKTKKIDIVDSNYNIFGIEDNIYYAGKFQCLTLQHLTNMLEVLKKNPKTHEISDFCLSLDYLPIKKLEKSKSIESLKVKNISPIEEEEEKSDNSNKKFELEKGLTFNNIGQTNVKDLICDEKNDGAVFQVASQFNCLEMVSPDVSPEDGITNYIYDHTQGPACALACSSALFYRNYLFKFDEEKGQLQNRQIDLLEHVDDYLGNTKNGIKQYWRVINGYCLTENPTKVLKLKERFEKEKDLAEEMKKKVSIGIHWETEVNIKKTNRLEISKQKICQVFCSTMALSYDKYKSSQTENWDPFCRNLLDAMYDATLTTAAILAFMKQRRIKVFLTAIGGGVFRNPNIWIKEAIQKSINKHKEMPLDVVLVSYSDIPKEFNSIN